MTDFSICCHRSQFGISSIPLWQTNGDCLDGIYLSPNKDPNVQLPIPGADVVGKVHMCQFIDSDISIRSPEYSLFSNLFA